MAKQFLNLAGLTAFLNQLKNHFASETEITEVNTTTETYLLRIDYESLLGFDTTEIITEEDA